MRFLRKLKIGPHNFKVKLKRMNRARPNPTLMEKHYAAVYYGECNFRTNEVNVEQNTSDSVKLETLMHELGHIICELTHMKFLNTDQEEDVCQNFGLWFLQILKENPRLLNLIRKYEPEEE